MPLALDTKLHAGASAAIAAASYSVARFSVGMSGSESIAVAGAFTLSIGASKELFYDLGAGRGNPEWRDMAANAVGTLIALGVIHLISTLVMAR